jgi:DNA-binding transcriptional MerR regulator
MKLFSIGDVAKMFHLSVSSLRHYERIGLLAPERVDPDTGYRYYSVRQFEPINIIRYLRALGMPLAEIADFLQNRDIGRMEEKLCQQKAAVAEKQRELARIERKIDSRLAQLRQAQTCRLDTIEQVRAEACRIVLIEDSLKIEGFLDMEAPIRRLDADNAQAVVFLGKVGVGISAEHLAERRFGQYDMYFLVLDSEDRFDGKTISLPETPCVRVRFRGSHGEAAAQYARLLDYIGQNGLEIAGASRELAIIDYGITNDTEKFVAEISIPVRKKA